MTLKRGQAHLIVTDLEGRRRGQNYDLDVFESEEVWQDDYDPELLKVREAAIRERVLEDFALNHLNIKSRLSFKLGDKPSETGEQVIDSLRKFKARCRDFEKAQVSNPYTRAFEEAYPSPTPWNSASLVYEALLTGSYVNIPDWKRSDWTPRNIETKTINNEIQFLYPDENAPTPTNRRAWWEKRDEKILNETSLEREWTH